MTSNSNKLFVLHLLGKSFAAKPVRLLSFVPLMFDLLNLSDAQSRWLLSELEGELLITIKHGWIYYLGPKGGSEKCLESSWMPMRDLSLLPSLVRLPVEGPSIPSISNQNFSTDKTEKFAA